MLRRLLVTALFCLLAAAPATAKDYLASRFDARIEVQPGGSLEITETVVFTFLDGTFREVFRTIPTRRSDGIEFVSASMDGVPLPAGDGPGQVEVRRRNGLRVTWHFPPTAGRAHTFELKYRALGIVQQSRDADLLEWTALPREHAYRIQTSRVEFILPVEPLGEAQVTERRVNGGLTVEHTGLAATVMASEIRKNGRFTVSIPFRRGTVISGPPAWQAREIWQRERMPIWLTAGGLVLAGCFILLFALREGGDHPPRSRQIEWTSLIPPEPLPPGLAGTLAANGQPHLEHAMATIFSLADRGIVTIREDPDRKWGQRSFIIQRTRAGEHLAPHEETALDIIFAKASGAEASVTIAKARSYLTRHWSRFKTALLGELADMRLTDPGRIAHRRRYMVAGLVLIGLGAVTLAGVAILARTYGPWPLFVPLAFVIGALTSFIVMSAKTPLSDDGLRRSEQWQAYKRHLRDPQGIETRWGSSGPAEARILPYAVALGLASAWSKFIKKGKVQAPSWFHAASTQDAGVSFSVFVATGGAGATGGGAGGGSGAAGGGGSGAG